MTMALGCDSPWSGGRGSLVRSAIRNGRLGDGDPPGVGFLAGIRMIRVSARRHRPPVPESGGDEARRRGGQHAGTFGMRPGPAGGKTRSSIAPHTPMGRSLMSPRIEVGQTGL